MSKSDARPTSRRLMIGSRASTIGAAALVVALTGALFTGIGAARSDVGFLDGGAWLWDRAQDVIGFSDPAMAADLNPRISAGGRQGVRIYQGAGGRLYAVDGSGEVTTVDASSSPAKLSRSPGRGKETTIRPGRRNSYLVDEAHGTIDMFAADSTPGTARRVARVRSRILTVIDRSDRLWVLAPAAGRLLVYRDGKEVARADYGRPGASAMSIVDDRAVIVTKGSDTASVVDAKGSQSTVKLDAAVPGRPVASSNVAEYPRTAFLVPSTAQVVSVSVEPGSGSTFTLTGREKHAFGAPEPIGSSVWVPDFTARELVKIDLRSGSVEQTLDVPWPDPSTADEFDVTVGADGTIWANQPDALTAIAVDRSGKVTRITKGQKPNVDTTDVQDDPKPDDQANVTVPPSADPSGPDSPWQFPAGPATTTTLLAPDPAVPSTTTTAVPDPAPPDQPPVITTDSAAGNRSIELGWRFPDGAVHRDVTFDVTWTDTSTKGDTSGRANVGADMRYVIENVRNGREYSVTVTARHPRLAQPLVSAPKAFTPTGNRPSAPRIGDVEWAALGNGTLRPTVTLSPPTEDGGSDITKVVVTMGGKPVEYAPKSQSSDWEVPLGPVAAGTTQSIEAVVVNEEQKSSTAARSTGIRVPALPGTPAMQPIVEAAGSITVKWNAATGDAEFPVTGYRIQTERAATEAVPGGASARSVVRTQAKNQQLRYRVQAVSAVGEGPWSTEVSGRSCDVPAAPTVQMSAAPAAFNRSSTVAASYLTPDDGGCAVTQYTVNGQPASTGGWNLPNVAPASTVTVDVVAYNYRGPSPVTRRTITTPARVAEHTRAIWTVTDTAPGGKICDNGWPGGNCAQELDRGWIRQEFIATGTILEFLYAEVCSSVRDNPQGSIVLQFEKVNPGNSFTILSNMVTASTGPCLTQLQDVSIGGFEIGQRYVVQFSNGPGNNWLVAYMNTVDGLADIGTFRHHNGYRNQCSESQFGDRSCADGHEVRLDLRMRDI